MPVTKRDKISEIIEKLINFCTLQGIPYFDDDVKIDIYRKKYTIDDIVGLIVKYLVPAYKLGESALEGYIKLEIERLRMMNLGNKHANYQISDIQIKKVRSFIVQIIDVIHA